MKPLSLKARAIALLAQREHSVAELRRKLLRLARERCSVASEVLVKTGDASHECESPPDEEGLAETRHQEVEALLAWLQAQGYLDESRFVESRLHARSQRWGQRRIELELAQHGLGLDAQQREQLAATELARACELLQRRFGSNPAVDAAVQAKQLRFLLGRGFAPELARRAMRQLGEAA